MNAIDIKLPKSNKGFFDDYVHRIMTINCQIVLCGSIECYSYSLQSYENYFERTKNENSSYWQTSTKLILKNWNVIPDSIFILSNQSKKRIFCLELHRWHRVLKIEKQLKSYGYVLAWGIVSEKYWIQSDPYILIIFEKESCLETTLERVVANSFYTYLRKHILFKTYDEFFRDPLSSWINLDQEKIHLLEF